VTLGNSKFSGGAYDGNGYIWMVPQDANAVVRVRIQDGAMTAYSTWPAGFANGNTSKFRGAVFDGTSVWMVPLMADRVVKIKSGKIEAVTDNPSPVSVSEIEW